MNEDNNLQISNGIKLKTFIPCKLVYPYEEHLGVNQNFTCVGVFTHLLFYDLPSFPRDVFALVLMDGLKGSYEIGLNIVDKENNKIIPEKIQKIDLTKENQSINYIFSLRNLVFQNEEEYFFQLIIDGQIFYRHGFRVLKILRQDYSPDELQILLDDTETIKNTTAFLHCECGFSKKFSLSLDPEKQKKEEKLPEEDMIKCEKCGNEFNIAEIKGNMHFYLGTKNLIDIFNRNLSESRTLAANGFLNASLIMQVSAFEAYMRDAFMLDYKNWFLYLIDTENDLDNNVMKIKQAIIKRTEQMKLKEQFHDQLFLLEKHQFESKLDEIDTYNSILKTLLFGSDDENHGGTNKVINFQQLNKEYGCFWAYKHFFGINLKSALDSQKDDYEKHIIN